MTSVKSSADTFGFTFWRTFKKTWMLPAALLIFMFVTIPFSYSGIFNTISLYNGLKMTRDFDNELYFAIRKFVFMDAQPYDYGFTSIFKMLALIGIPALSAVQIFRFVASKKMVNVYYSLGITRKNMFIAKYSCGALMLTAAIFIPIAVSAIANAAFFGVCKEMLISHLYYFLNYEVLAMICFGVTAATLSCVGSVAEGAIYSGILLLTPTAIVETIENMMGSFLYGAPYGSSYRILGEKGFSYVSSSVLSQKRWLNPLSQFIMGENTDSYKYVLEDVTKPDSHSWVMPDFSYAIVWGIAAVLVFFVGLAIFKRRKAEISGFLGANRLLSGVCVFFTGMGTSALFLAQSFSDMDLSEAAYLGIAFLFIFVFYTMASLILYRSFKGYFKRIYMVLPHFALYTALALVFISGLFGFSSKMPDKSEIKSVSISSGTAYSLASPGSAYTDNYAYVEPSLKSEQDLVLTQSGLKAMSAVNLHTYDESVVGNLSSQQDIDFALKIHKQLIDIKGIDYSDKNINNPDASKRPIGSPVWVVYELKNGKTFERRYSIVTQEILNELAAVQGSEAYKQIMLDAFTEEQIQEYDPNAGYYPAEYGSTGYDFFAGRSIGLASANLITRTDCTQFTEDPEFREALLAAIREDISAGRAHTDLVSDKPAIGYICAFDPSWNTFAIDGESKSQVEITEAFGDSVAFSLVGGGSQCLPVYADMTSTIAFLAQNDLIKCFVNTQQPVKARICKLGDMSDAKRFYEGHFNGCTSEINGSVYYYEVGNTFFAENAQTFTGSDAAYIAANTRYSGMWSADGAYVELIYEDGTVVHGYIYAQDIPQ